MIQNSQLESGELVKFIEKTRPDLALDPQQSPPVSVTFEDSSEDTSGLPWSESLPETMQIS